MLRFAVKEDIPAIMKFINDYWKKGHILATNETEFRYEYEDSDKVNMVLAINNEGEIDGLEGFIPYGEKNRDITLALWKVRKTDNPTLGMEIVKYLRENADAKTISCLGINLRTIGLYQFMGMNTGNMSQWYRLAPKSKYHIAVVSNPQIPVAETKAKLVKYTSFHELMSAFNYRKYIQSDATPKKEDWYIEKRYFNHPIYKYDVYGIETSEEKTNTLLVFRKQEMDGNTALRCVDLIGKFDEFYSVTKAVDGLLNETGAEYVDFYEVGMSEQDMMRAGWLKVRGSGNIIPNYFSPFVQKNIDIVYSTDAEQVYLFKADGDQDRPS